MPSASNTSNSSNISTPLLNLNVQSELGSRLLVQIQTNNFSGFTGGDVIRYDVPTSGYTLAKADTASNSEVFGIVEDKEEPNLLNVVIYGSINYPTEKLINDTGTNYGGNDVYFLSASNAGKLVNIPSTTIGNIVKPIYQVGPHLTLTGLAATGIVVNYVGYVIQE
jgi:hypothetical protein